MRLAALLVAAGTWAGCARPAPVAVLTTSTPACPPPVGPVERGATSVALQQELDDIDRELDAIDDVLIAAERTSGLSPIDAIDMATRRQLALQDLDVDRPATADEPLLLARIRARYLVKRGDTERLAGELGQRHPQMVAAGAALAHLRRDYLRQRDLELDFARAWQRELLAVPAARAPKNHAYAARVRALAPLLAATTTTGLVPSDAPAHVVLAAIELAELQLRHDENAAELGPKHPEMVALATQIAGAERALREAIQTPVPATAATIVDGKLVARRSELAKRARVLRADLRRD